METFIKDNQLLIIISALWVLPWKGYALWTASRMNHKKWFIAIVVLNTFAILEIFYLFYVVKKTPKDIIRLFKTKL